ncbi:MAG: hypothetical protein HY420_00100 [Candidatus Kerfeldbacteria bacterium]|nr:hypothetical protein [Candidatus Kerfeldbacteria bacterium]
MDQRTYHPGQPPSEIPPYPQDPGRSAADFAVEEEAAPEAVTDEQPEDQGEKKPKVRKPAKSETTGVGAEPEKVVAETVGQEQPVIIEQSRKAASGSEARQRAANRKLDEERKAEQAERTAYEKAMGKLTQMVKDRRSRLKAMVEDRKLDWNRNREEIEELAEDEASNLAQSFNERGEQFAVVKHLLGEVHLPGAQTVSEKFKAMAMIGLLQLEYWSRENFRHRLERKVGKKMTGRMEQDFDQQWKELVQRLQTEAPELFEQEVTAEAA